MAQSELISVRVTKETAKRLKALARATDRSKSYLAAEAIQDYLDLQEWQVAAIKKGLADLDAGRVVSHEEVKRKLARWKKRGG